MPAEAPSLSSGLSLTHSSAYLVKSQWQDGIGTADLMDDLALGATVDLGDEVVACLEGHPQLIRALEVTHDQIAGRPCCGHGDVNEGVHGQMAAWERPKIACMTEPPVMPSLRIVLVYPQHPGNIGAAARAMKTMGFADLALVAPREFPHPNAEAMAAGAGDVLRTARVCSSVAEAVGDCTRVVATTARSRSLSLPVFEPREWAPRWASGSLGSQVALLFGSERVGLTNEVLDSCQEMVSIPAGSSYSSLNLAQAVQVLCYELHLTQAQARPPDDHEPVEQAELELFFAHLEQVLIGLAFLDPDNPRLLMRRLRRLFARAAPDFNEVNILRGILTAVEARFDRPAA